MTDYRAKHQAWLDAQRAKNRARDQRRAAATEFQMGIDEMLALLKARGLEIDDALLLDAIDEGIPLLRVSSIPSDGLALDVEAFVQQVARLMEWQSDFNRLRDQVYALDGEDDISLDDMNRELRRQSRDQGKPVLLSWRARNPEGEGEGESDRYFQNGVDTGRDLVAWQREEEDEDLAYDLLTQRRPLDAQIARGWVTEDDQHHLTLTPLGWAAARAQAAWIMKLVTQAAVERLVPQGG